LYTLAMSLENPSSRKSGIESRIEASDTEKEKTIRSSHTFEQLYSALDKVGSIKGSSELFQPEDLKSKIERVRAGTLDLNFITRTFGLRETVAELLEQDERSPKPKPPFQATVALELPSEEVSKEEVSLEDSSPKDPSPFEAGATASAEKARRPEDEDSFDPIDDEPDPKEPSSDISIEEPKDMETHDELGEVPTDPVPTLSPEDADFLKQAEKDLRSPLRREERYFEILSRKQTIDRQRDDILYAKSFADLQDALNSTNAENTAELAKRIERVWNGTGTLDDLPQSIRSGAENVLATQAVEKLERNQQVSLQSQEWNAFLTRNPVDLNYLGNRVSMLYNYPAIGAMDVKTREGIIDGELVWANEEGAIFKKGDTFVRVPMEEIVMDNDKTYGEIKKEQEVRSRLSKNKLQAREIPPS
jgi:hypothetical protein